MAKKWMIYGATGYTGELIAREAVQRGMAPLLAGRNAAKLRLLSEELGLEMRAFQLDDQTTENIEDVYLILHCAGPFHDTSKSMIKACLEVSVHYLDITGEISVFEHTHAQGGQAARNNMVICSGVGFDVIPTDCTALKLKELMPDANHLALGFESDSGVSPGTLKTMINGFGSGSAERQDGVLMPVPVGSQQRIIDFGLGSRSAMGIPWGDVSTAFYTTGIPNISTWIPLSKKRIQAVRLLGKAGSLLSYSVLQKPLKRWVERKVSGPDQAARKNTAAYIWGEARNALGEIKTVRIQTANVYDVTVYGALEVATRLLEREYPGGSYTPAGLFGADLVEQLPGSGKFEVE